MRSPDPLLLKHAELLEKAEGPVLDLACGDGHNGLFLASRGCRVVLADVSEEALDRARTLSRQLGATVSFWKVDLEKGEGNPFGEDDYGAILVFRYLHRPLMPCIRKAVKRGGIVVYETFTVEQPRFGKPRNPHHLLKPGELREWFKDWELIDELEGILQNPERAIAQIVCRRP